MGLFTRARGTGDADAAATSSGAKRDEDDETTRGFDDDVRIETAAARDDEEEEEEEAREEDAEAHEDYSCKTPFERLARDVLERHAKRKQWP